MNNLEIELKSVNEARKLNKNVFDNIEKDLDEKEKNILLNMSHLHNSELSTSEIKNLGKLLEHIITIINSDETIGWIISLRNEESNSNPDYDRGKYSIEISCYTIEEYDHIGLRYGFTFNTMHPKINELICNVLTEPSNKIINNISWGMYLYEADLSKKYILKYNKDYLLSLKNI